MDHRNCLSGRLATFWSQLLISRSNWAFVNNWNVQWDKLDWICHVYEKKRPTVFLRHKNRQESAKGRWQIVLWQIAFGQIVACQSWVQRTLFLWELKKVAATNNETIFFWFCWKSIDPGFGLEAMNGPQYKWVFCLIHVNIFGKGKCGSCKVQLY